VAEMHNPMELHVTTAFWEGENKVTLYTKSQGVIRSQMAIATAFGLDPENSPRPLVVCFRLALLEYLVSAL